MSSNDKRISGVSKNSKTSEKKKSSVDASKLRRSKRAQITAKASDISIALSEIFSGSFPFLGGQGGGQQLLNNFRGCTVAAIQNSFIQYLKDEFLCTGSVVLQLVDLNEKFQVFGSFEPFQKTAFLTKNFVGIPEAISKKAPIIIDEHCECWKQIFGTFLPKVVLLVPCRNTKTQAVDNVTVLGFADTTPVLLGDQNICKDLIATCRLMSHLLVNAQRYETDYKTFKQICRTFDSVRNVSREIQQIDSCINTIGIESQSLFNTTHSVIFVLLDEIYDPQLMKYSSLGGGNIDASCPNRESHTMEILPQVTTFPAGWAALNKKSIRINNLDDLSKFCGTKGPIHSIGGCIGRNIMCFIIEDYSSDMPLLVEVTDKIGGFTEDDQKEAFLFSKFLSPVLSSTVMLDYRRKAIRRNDITNELLNNIKTVQFIKVQHLLDMKFRYSNTFQRKFFTSKFVFRHLTPGQYPGVIMFMFTELGFIQRWKIRRVTLIRFILSIQQGYRDNPYHNWKHACTVAHFAFIFIKKLDLQKDGYLQDIEAFALVVACLCHDIDHRGVNNHFSLCADNDPYHLYLQEDSLMERHHVAVTMQVLASDDCNIAENLSDDEYKEFMELLQWTILATDIGKYLQTRTALFAELKNFDKKERTHRKALMSALMTACDLCETIKPWNDYIPSVKCIFSEFFTQGDEELKLGFIPTPIMDRRIAYIPYIEMKFINEIVRPVYQALSELIPKTADCVHTIDYYKELWLVATRVFDDNSHKEDPLDILDLPELREERLKTVDNPELEEKASKIRHSLIVHNASLINIPDGNGGPPPTASNTSNAFPMNSAQELVELEKERPTSCKERLMNFFCCIRCRRKALYDASLIRRTHRETEFMEERSEDYEAKRSSLDQSIHFDGTASVRDRINSLLNPFPPRLKKKSKR